jgi:hypothetical protein
MDFCQLCFGKAGGEEEVSNAQIMVFVCDFLIKETVFGYHF